MQAYRASILHLLDDPGVAGEAVIAFHADGLLVVDKGYVVACGDHARLSPHLGDAPVHELPGRLITPGFVDLHVHFPQTDIIASHGDQLLDWLERYVFPAEAAFAEPAHAAQTARFFVSELLANGTTTALVFGSSHRVGIDALFTDALSRNMRLIAGKSLMDRLAPDGVRDTLEGSRRDTLGLIADWSGKGRLGLCGHPPIRPHQHP